MADTTLKFNGEPTAESLATGLATLGRYGDTYMVHASDGETIIPAEILDANPRLKNDLFDQMKQMGIGDPNRYVVGNGLNSINPITGQPEFFFKKVFKAVKKVFKKALPVVAPIVGNMIAPGIGGLIASGLVTKMQGGSWGDVAKNVALTYGVSALGQGLGGAFAGGKGFSGEGFMSGLGQGLSAPIDAAGNLFSSGPQNPFNQGIFGQNYSGGMLPTYDPNVKPDGGGGGGLNGKKERIDVEVIDLNGERPTEIAIIGEETDLASYKPGAELRSDSAIGQGLEKVSGPISAYEGSSKAVEGTWKDKLYGAVAELAVPVALAGLTYFMAEDEPELTPDQARELSDPQRSAYDKYLRRGAVKDEEGQRLLAQAGVVPSSDPVQLAQATGTSLDEAKAYLGSIYGSHPLKDASDFQAKNETPTMYSQMVDPHRLTTAAGGGEIMGPGTGTSDSIPARLSDGEFVMTADAVRGAGRGNRNIGAARMYDLMSRFERAA